MSTRARPLPNLAAPPRGLLVACAVASALAPALAQGPAPSPASSPPPPLSPDADVMEGRPVRRIVVRVFPRHPKGGTVRDPAEATAPDTGTERFVRNNLRLREGSRYDGQVARDDVSRLNRLGPFKSVESSVQLVDDGGVWITYDFVLQPVIEAVQVVGNRLLTDQEIADVSNVLVHTSVDNTQIDRISRRIEEMYREKGYYNCTVSVDADELEKTGTLIFRIREGEKTRVRDVSFRGNLTYTPAELRKDLKTREASLLDRGTLDDEALKQDVATLASFYKDRGHLDVRADKRVILSGDGREALVVFEIDEGPVYTLRSVKADFGDEPNPAFSAAQLLALMAVKPGDVYGVNSVRKSVRNVTEAFQKLGYVVTDPGERPQSGDTLINRVELRAADRPEIDLLIVIIQGKPYKTGEVIVKGNEITRREVVLRSVTLQPDRPLDGTALDLSRRRLANSRLFKPEAIRLTIQPPDDLEPEHRDVLVEVAETNTGEFGFGATLSSDGGVGGRFSITQRNFDISNTPDTFGEVLTGGAFRGAGQTFNALILPGDRAQTFSMSLFEPSLWESDYSGNISTSARRRIFKDFTENRFGGSLALGRNFGSRWRGSLPVRVESIGLNTIDASAPQDFFDVEAYHLLTSVGLGLSRTTFDNPARPTKGTGISLSVEQVGALGGEFTYNVVRAEHKVFVPLVEDFFGHSTVLSFETRANYIPQSTDSAPFYERFTLGGQNFRGFDFRGISPRGIRRDTGLPGDVAVGGNFSFFWGTEIQQPLYEDKVAVVVFLDTGTVNTDLSFARYRASTGFGIRIALPFTPVPFALDFGFPLLRDATDDERVLSFTFDVPFR